MEKKYKMLGKVCLTCEGKWNNTFEYDNLCIVYTDFDDIIKSYISKKDVPIGADIEDEEYWQPLAITMEANTNIENNVNNENNL